jgi:hypothetical protein
MTPRSELGELRRVITNQFPASERDDVYTVVEPFTDGGIRVAMCILHLACGNKAQVEHYADCARRDYRDVIFWAETPREAALDSPRKIDDFQATLEWLGLPRDKDLDHGKQQLHASKSKDSLDRDRRPWWRFW